MSNKLLSVNAVCAEFSPPPAVRTVDRWVKDRRIGFPQPIYIGKRRYWPADEIAEFKARKVRERSAATANDNTAEAHHAA